MNVGVKNQTFEQKVSEVLFELIKTAECVTFLHWLIDKKKNCKWMMSLLTAIFPSSLLLSRILAFLPPASL